MSFDPAKWLINENRDVRSNVPTVDMANWFGGDSDAQMKTANQLFSAFYHVGFAVIINHSIQKQTLDTSFDLSRRLFGLPDKVKSSMPYTTTERNRGYICQYGESLEGTGTAKQRIPISDIHPGMPGMPGMPDMKESFDIGSREDTLWEDIWPEPLMPEFREHFLGFRSKMDELHRELMKALCLFLELPGNHFDSYYDKREYSLRLLHYPPIGPHSITRPGQKRAGSHTDYNTLTMLVQDDIGGLQVLNAADQWIDVDPVPGAIVINIGDLFERWSNGLFRSTVHRVVQPPGSPGDETKPGMPSRYSMAYFIKPNRKSIIHCLPCCCNQKFPARYAPVECFEYVNTAFKEANNENKSTAA